MMPKRSQNLIYTKKLKKGEACEMVTQYSDDKSSISKGGVVDPFAPQRRQEFVKAVSLLRLTIPSLSHISRLAYCETQ